MITVNYKGGKVIVKFSGDNFSTYVSIMRRNRIPFNPQEKGYEFSPAKFLSLKESLEEDEELTISEEDLSLIEENQWGTPETVFKRTSLHPNAIKRPPIKPFQIEDALRMVRQNRIINTNEVGLGKTYETIVALNHHFLSGNIDSVFIITIGETIYNWKREILKFGVFAQEEDILIVSTKNRELLDQWKEKKVIITSYSTFTLISDYYYKLKNKGKTPGDYRKPTFDFNEWSKNACIVLDEAHKIKSRGSKTAKRIGLYKNFFNIRYLLTATLYPNSLLEAWNPFFFVDEGVLGKDYYSYESFIYNQKQMSRGGNVFKVNEEYRVENVAKIVDRIKPWIIQRFKKVEMPEMPELNIKNIFVEPTKKILSIYQTVVESELKKIKEVEGYFLPQSVVNKFPYLSLAVSDPTILIGKLEGSEISKELLTWQFRQNPKLEILEDIISDHEEEKIIVWSTHPVTINLLTEYFTKRYGSDKIISYSGQTDTGKLSKEQYRDMVVQKVETENIKLAILSPLVMGTGVSFVESSVAVSWDRSWSEIVWLQSVGRNHRIVSRKDVNHYVLIMDKTLEVYQNEVLEGRTNINTQLLSKDELPMTEWVKIFSGEESE